MTTNDPAHPPRGAYAWYLGGSSLWMAGMSLQGFMFTWMLVGILERPAGDVGFARSLAEFPPLVILFLGGLLGDRYNGRTFLACMHVLMAVPPLLLAVVSGLDLLDYWWVVAFGVLMSGIQALSDPARQSILNRVTRLDTQRAVTVMIICTSLVGLSGFYLGGRLDVLGLTTVLVLQSLAFLAGLGATLRLPSLPMTAAAGQGRPVSRRDCARSGRRRWSGT
jgi:nitrate/nitrite transporter NarK